MDVDTLEAHDRLEVTLVAARADDRDVVSGPSKRETLLPHPPVLRDREVLHQH